MPPLDRPRARRTGRHGVGARLAPLALVAGLAVLGGCSRDHSVFTPRSSEGHRIAFLGWLMLAIAAGVFLLVMTLLLVSLLSGRRRGGRRFLLSERHWVVLGGIAMPTIVLLMLSGFTVWALDTVDEPAAPDALHLEITGHQFWWEIRYPDSGVVTANEFHVPVGTDVDIRLTSADVQHSLWVPQFGPKKDLYPGRVNPLVWHPTRTGTFRGQCAEYCGLQHANMALYVTVDTPQGFQAWLDQQAQPARPPATDQERTGEQAFVAEPCAGCHTIRGTAARGTRGPDLTHVGSRQTLAAGALPNDAGHIGGWISNSQTIKPGNLMPPVALTPGELNGLIVYLESLR